MERRLAAIMAADVVGYSRLIRADEEGTIAALKTLRAGLIDPKIAEHRGRIVKLMGDGMLVEFASIVDAVHAAVETQQAVSDHNSDIPADKRIELRIGINLGDVVIDGDDIQGDGVNVAARLEGMAEPGGICISGMVYEGVRDRIDVPFEDLGNQEVKNIDRPVRVWRWVADGSGAVVFRQADEPLPLPDKPSIAVLPFTNMSGDPEQEYFADGITEDIITELARFSGLFVIARNSTFSYKGQVIDVRRIARELGVRYILVGSIRRAGNRVRINAQLIEKEAGSHIWSERYDRNLEDIFDLQEEITRNVVASIAPQIEMAEMERALRARGTNVSAYDLALKAQSQVYEGVRIGSPEVLEKAIQTAQESLEKDPRNLHALWTQAFANYYRHICCWGSAADQALDSAWAIIARLFQIDPSNSQAYSLRGELRVLRGEYDKGNADFHRAYALNPNSAFNLFYMACSESLSGLTGEAKEHAELGLRLSPRDLDINLGVAYLALAQASFADGDFENAMECCKVAIQMHSKAPYRRALMIACCGHLGHLDEAARQVTDLYAFAPDFLPSVLRGDMIIYKMPAHNALFVDGLRKAGPPE